MAKLYFIHRWLGLAVCVPVLCWTLSGIAHPIMTFRNLRPAVSFLPRAPVDPRALRVPPAQLLQTHGIKRISNLRIVRLNETTAYQVQVPDEDSLRYFDSASGELIPDGDYAYAEQLARYFTGDANSPVARIDLIRSFDREYAAVNRFLPVYRVEFHRPDRLRAYVDTSYSRLGAVADRINGWLLWSFAVFHTWDIFDFSIPLRQTLLVAFSLLVCAGGMSGLLIYGRRLGKMSRGGTPQLRFRRLHRWAGLLFSVTMLLAAASGCFHAAYKLARTEPGLLGEVSVFDPAELEGAPTVVAKHLGDGQQLLNYSLIRNGRNCFYRLERLENGVLLEPLCIHSSSGAVWNDGELAYARQLANAHSKWSDADVVAVESIDQFGPEYGFIYRRLPVVRVQYNRDDNVRYYVETASGAIALIARDTDVIENWTFSSLHKWGFADFLGRKWRDGLLGVVTLGAALVAALGIVLLVFSIRPVGPAVQGPVTMPVAPAVNPIDAST